MPSFPLIDIVIGMVFVYLLLSLICSALKELIESKWKMRSTLLRQGVDSLIGSAWVDKLYGHGLIRALYRAQDQPSYIPAQTFAKALLDLVDKNPGSVPPQVKEALDAIQITARNDADKVQKAVEDWYNGAMDRVSGWFKRHTQWALVAIGLIVTVALNVDSVQVADALSKNSALAFAVSNSATQFANQNSQLPATTTVQGGQAQVAALGLPVGWNGGDDGHTPPWATKDPFHHGLDLLWMHWIGWLTTIIAISFGAPFWFDVLNRFMVVRSTVKPDEKSPAEPSKS